MVTIAGISFGLFVGTLVCILLHPVFRLKISPERRLKLVVGTLTSLLGAGVAGALLSLLGLDAVVGMVLGIFPGFIGAYIYLERRDERRVRQIVAMSPAQRSVAERALTGQLDPQDPTSARELEALLDGLNGSGGDD